MDPDPNQTCQRCGAEIPATASEKVCPRCALADALNSSAGDHDTRFLSLHDIPPAGQKVSYIGNYELLEVIAHGGMGVVYRARQKSLNRIVALKLLLGGQHASEGFKRRFKQEAEMAASLQHPNIVPIYEVGEHEGQPYFSMEYVAGTNLAVLTRDRPLPPSKAADSVKTVAEAVAYAHQQGVLHRDLKPSNILVGHDGRPRITDFGLARQMDADSSLTASGEMLGTPGYLPPEQVSTKGGKVGPQSDVYSLGAVLFNLLTGRPPFMAGTIVEVLQQVLETEPVPLRRLNPSIPLDLETICLKCLEKDMNRRYDSAESLANDLGRFLHGEPVLARRVSLVERANKWVRRHRMVSTLTMAIFLAITFGVAGFNSEWHKEMGQRNRVANDSLHMAMMLRTQFEFRTDSTPEQIKSAFEQLLSQRASQDTNGDEALIIRVMWMETLQEKGYATAAEPLARGLLGVLERKIQDSNHERFSKRMTAPRLFDVDGLLTFRYELQDILGRCLFKEGKYGEAEPILSAWLEPFKKSGGTMGSVQAYSGAEIMREMAQVFAYTGRLHLASEWQFKAVYYDKLLGRAENLGAEKYLITDTDLWHPPDSSAVGTWLFEELPDTRSGAPINTNLAALLPYAGISQNGDGTPADQGPCFSAGSLPWIMWNTNRQWLDIHPGATNSAASIGFTAVRGGRYQIKGTFARENKVVDGGDGVSVAIIRERDTTNMLFQTNISSSAKVDWQGLFHGEAAAPFDLNLLLRPGDTLRLLVFNGPPGVNSWGWDATGLSFDLALETATNEPLLTFSSKTIFNQLLNNP